MQSEAEQHFCEITMVQMKLHISSHKKMFHLQLLCPCPEEMHVLLFDVILKKAGCQIIDPSKLCVFVILRAEGSVLHSFAH